MPFLDAISIIDFPHKVNQQEVKATAKALFLPQFPQIERLMSVFDNTEIRERNFCKPLGDYTNLGGFKQRNDEYIRITLEYGVKAIENCIKQSGVSKEEITDFIFVSTTGLATPSMDALIMNYMGLNANMKRTPIFGLGCAGGVSGFAKANTLAKENPDAVVLFVAAELCSLTFLQNDFTKSNFVGASLFSDGIAACIIKGDHHAGRADMRLEYVSSQSKLYKDSLDVMGWEFCDEGFRVIFSQDIPTIVRKNIYPDIISFLTKHKLELKDIHNFIFHPGGKKVLEAYEEALQVGGDFLKHTRGCMNEYGNMSSVSVLYVLKKAINKGLDEGYGLMVALGPGFSSEMVLLSTIKPFVSSSGDENGAKNHDQ